MSRKIPEVETSAPEPASAASDAPTVEFVTEQVMCWVGMSMRLASRRPMSDGLDALNDLGLTMPQVVALHVVAFEGSATMTRIVERTGLSPSAVSHLVHRLVNAGLLERKDDPVDRRQKRVRLTTDGQALIKKLMRARVADTRTSIEPLSEETRKKLSEVLELVTADLAVRIRAEAGPLPHEGKGPRSLDDVLAHIERIGRAKDPDGVDVDGDHNDHNVHNVHSDHNVDVDDDLNAVVSDIADRAAALGDAIADRAAAVSDAVAERAAAVGAAAGARVAKQMADAFADLKDVHARKHRARKQERK